MAFVILQPLRGSFPVTGHSTPSCGQDLPYCSLVGAKASANPRRVSPVPSAASGNQRTASFPWGGSWLSWQPFSPRVPPFAGENSNSSNHSCLTRPAPLRSPSGRSEHASMVSRSTCGRAGPSFSWLSWLSQTQPSLHLKILGTWLTTRMRSPITQRLLSRGPVPQVPGTKGKALHVSSAAAPSIEPAGWVFWTLPLPANVFPVSPQCR